MKIVKNNIVVSVRISEIFYYLFWIIMLYAKGTGLYEGMRQYNICLISAMACLGIKLLFTEYQMLELIWMSVLVLFGGWIYIHSGEQSAFILVAVMIGLKNIKLPHVFRIGMYVFGGCFIYMIFRSLLGIGDLGPMLVHEKLGLGPILRWSLGYTHPNVLQITYVIVSCFILYNWNMKLGREQNKITVLLMLGNLYIFLYSMSFTGFLFMLVLLILNYYLNKQENLNKIEQIGLFIILPVCVLFSLVAPLVLKKDGFLFTFFNKVMNNRFLATRTYLEELGINLWGMRVPRISGFAIDCSYTEALLFYGGVFSLLLLIMYLATIWNMIKKERKKELVIILALMTAGVSEPFLFNASFKNITVLFIGEYLFDRSFDWGKAHEACWLAKKISFLQHFDREYRVKAGWLMKKWEGMKEAFRRSKKALIPIMIVGFLFFSLLGGWIIREPESIYVNVRLTDCEDQEIKYLDVENIPEDFHSKIYGYAGPEEPMYEFKGNMVKVEKVRSVVSIGVWGAIFAAILVVSANMWSYRKT